jgi:hypothetical protein
MLSAGCMEIFKKNIIYNIQKKVKFANVNFHMSP